MIRTVLVGEMNPHRADPRFALYPLPPAASGGRLAKIMGLTAREYLRAYPYRYNVCGGEEWDAREALLSAERIILKHPDPPMVLLGARVAVAFGFRFVPFKRVGRFLMLPHPSGRCRIWNNPRSSGRARRLIRALGGE